MNHRDELRERLEELQKQLRERFSLAETHGELIQTFGTVTVHQLTALRILVESGPLTMHELGEHLHIKPSAVTQLVDRLEQHGLVERAKDDEDRRVQRLVVTPLASKAARRFKQARRRQIDKLIAPLKDDELTVLVSLAERMLHGAEQTNGGAAK